MLLNAKLNYTARKILWIEAVHTRERVRNSMATTGSTKSPSAIFYGEKLNIIVFFSKFGHIAYITKGENQEANDRQDTQGPYGSILRQSHNIYVHVVQS